MLYAAMRLEGVCQTSFFVRSGNFLKRRLASRPCDAATEAGLTLMALVAQFPGPPAWMRTHDVPPEVEKRFKQARSRQWCLRDIAGYLAFATVLSLLYVLIACSLDAQFAATTSKHHNSCLQSRSLTPYHSTAYDAPTAAAFHKLSLYPLYGSYAAKLEAPAGAAAAEGPGGCSASQRLTLVQLLYRNAAAAVARVSRHSSSMGLGMLLQPRLLLRSAPLLYLWRLWFMADMLLMMKSALCLVSLCFALWKPGLYRKPGVRTAIIATYILLPLTMLPLRLLTCNHPHMMNAAVDSTAAAAAAPSLPLRAATAAAAAVSSPPQHIVAAAFAAMRSIDPEQLPTWPASYFTTCPVPTTAEAFRALLAYASFVVILDSVLHPLPMLWRAAVNAASWACLASCGVLIKARYAPVAMTVAAAPSSVGVDSSAGSATALGEEPSSSTAASSGGGTDVTILLWEVLASSLDGLVLAVLLPVLVSAWSTHRSRQKFLRSCNVAQDVLAESRDLLGKHADALRDEVQKQQQLDHRSGSIEVVRSAAADAGASSSAAASVLAPVTPAISDSSVGLGLGLQISSKQVVQARVQQQQQQQASSSSNMLASATAAKTALVSRACKQGRGQSSRHVNLATALSSNTGCGGSNSSSNGPAAATAAPDTPRSSLESTASSSGNTVAAGKHGKYSTGGSSSSGSNSPQEQRQAAATRSSSSLAVSAAAAAEASSARLPGTITNIRPTAAATAAAGPVGLPPGSPSGSLYSSPLETVIISFKLASSSRSGRGTASILVTPAATVAAAPVQTPAVTEDYAPAGSTEVAPPIAAESYAGASAPAAATSGGGSGSGWASPGFLQQQQELAAAGASRQLQAAIEAAVRTVVAQSQLHVLTTSVSTFPGCVHVVMSVNLVALQELQRLAAATASVAAAAGADVVDARAYIDTQHNSLGSSSIGSSNAVSYDNSEAVGVSAAAAGAGSSESQAVPLAKLVDWGQVVHQLQQQGVVTTEGGIADVACADSAGDAAACPLQLQYMLVQDGSGQETLWYWQRGASTAAAANANDLMPGTARGAAAAAAVADAANASGAGTIGAAASFLSAVQRASLDLPTATAAPVEGAGGGGGSMGPGGSSEGHSNFISSEAHSNATNSDAHALIDSTGSSAHGVYVPAYTHGASTSSATGSSRPALPVHCAPGGLEIPSPCTPHQSAALHPTVVSAALGSTPPAAQSYAQQTLDMQAASNSRVRAEMLAAAEARAAAAVFGGTYAAEVAAAPFGNPTGWPAAAAAAAAAPVTATATGSVAELIPSPSSAVPAVSGNAGIGEGRISSSVATPAPQHRTPQAATDHATAALNRVSSILAHARSVTLSSFNLPSDRARLDHASLAPVLTVPDSLAASLAAQWAGLRIVVTEVAAGSNGLPDYVGYGPSGLSRQSGPSGLTVGSWNDHASLSQCVELPGPVDIWQTRSAGQAALLRNGQSGLSIVPHVVPGAAAGVSAAAAVLSDVTFWPNSSAVMAGAVSDSTSSRNSSHRIWPVGGQVELPGLLPHCLDNTWLAQHNGSVLAVNVLATPTKHASGPDAGTTAGAVSLVSEFVLLQLPLLVVPSAVCAALTGLAARMAAEAGSCSRAYHSHLLPLVRDIASLLLERPTMQRAAAHVDAGEAATDVASQQVCLGVLGFLQAQGLDECAAILQHLAGWEALPAVATAAAAAEVVPVAAAAAGDGFYGCVGPVPVAAAAAEIELEAALDDAMLQSDDGDIITEYVPYTSAAPAAGPAAAAAVAQYTTPLTADAAAAAGIGVGKSVKGEALLPQNPNPTVVKAVKQAQAAREDAKAARQTAAQASAALASAIQALSSLSANAAAAAEQAQRAENTAAEAARRAEAAESWALRQRALQLIGSGHVESGPLGLGLWGLMGSARASSGAEDVDNMFSGPPQLPERVTWRDVLLGFKDARLEVQYRRLKAIHMQFIDRAVLLLHVVREATVMWRLGMMLMQQAGGSQLSLVLLCKYEAVTVLPYVVSVLFPDFYIHHRNFMLMLSQIACALTMGMITATEIYRHEWSQLLSPDFTPQTVPIAPNFTPGATGSVVADSAAAAAAATAAAHAEKGLLARPAMLVVWFYLVVPLLQQLCVPEQLFGSCLSQAVQTLLAYKFIFKGQMPVLVLLPWLLVGAAVSFGVAYVSDWYFRRQAVAAARRSLDVGRPVPVMNGDRVHTDNTW